MLPEVAAQEAKDEDETNPEGPEGDISKDTPSQNDPTMNGPNVTSQQHVINRSKPTQSTSALVKVKDP